MASVTASASANVRAVGTTGISVTHGFTLTNNEVVYAFCGQGDDVGSAWASASGGTWTQLANRESTSGADQALGVLRRVITDAAGEPSSYTFTRTGNSGTDNFVVVVLQVAGADTSTPEDATTTIDGGQDDTTPDNVDITTNTDNAMVLCAHLLSTFKGDWSQPTAGAPSTYTNVNDDSFDNSVNNMSIFIEVAKDEDVGSAGAQAIGSWTTTGGSAEDEFGTTAVAVKPASAAATRRYSLPILGVG